MISITDFNNWRTDPVTVAFMSAINQRIEEAKDTLSTSAGTDVNQDNFLRGFIFGQREVLAVSFEEVVE